MSWAVRQKLPCTQKMALLMLAERHNGDSGQCNPSHDRLAEDCGLTRRSVMDQIEKLVAAGYIRIRHRSAGNVKLSNQYVLVFSFGVQEEIKDCPEVVNDVHYPVVKQVHGVVNVVPGVVNVVHQGSEPRSHKPVKEPVKETREKTSAQAPSLFVLPEWINPKHWDTWHSSAKRKKASIEQKQMAVDKLTEWKAAGLDFAGALENSANGGWASLFLPDEKKAVVAAGKGGTPAQVSAVWHESASGVDRKAAELGLAPIGSLESRPVFKARVLASAANPPMNLCLS